MTRTDRPPVPPRLRAVYLLILAGFVACIAGVFAPGDWPRILVLGGWGAIILALYVGGPVPRAESAEAGPRLVPDALALRHLYRRFDEFARAGAPLKGERAEIAWLRLVAAFNRVRGVDGDGPETAPVCCAGCHSPAVFLASGMGSAGVLAAEAQEFERTGLCAACRIGRDLRAHH